MPSKHFVFKTQSDIQFRCVDHSEVDVIMSSG